MKLSEARTGQPSPGDKPDTETNSETFFREFFFSSTKCNLQIRKSKSYLKNVFLVKAVCRKAFSNEIATLALWPSRKAQCSMQREEEGLRAKT